MVSQGLGLVKYRGKPRSTKSVPATSWRHDKENEVNPIWTKMIVDAVEKVTRKCPHCKKSAAYPRKQPGQFHKCQRCSHRFKEKGR